MFGLSKIADRDFVVGFVLPILITSALTAFLFRDTTTVHSVYVMILDQKSFTSLTMLVLVVWALATLLMTWNHSIYRLLEGYTGPFKRDEWRSSMVKRFSEEQVQLKSLYDQSEALKGAPGKEAEREECSAEYLRRLRKQRVTFPFREDLILPTRFGNVIRAFEAYSLRVYGVDSIPTWGRLVGVIPSSYAALINGARSEVTFFVNIWALAIVFVALALGKAVVELYRGYTASACLLLDIETPIAVGGGIFVAIAAYNFAIERAVAWGEMVKSAFDLYLPALAKQLGYALPSTRDGRLKFWDAVNAMFLVQTPILPENWEPAPLEETRAEGDRGRTEDAKRENGEAISEESVDNENGIDDRKA